MYVQFWIRRRFSGFSPDAPAELTALFCRKRDGGSILSVGERGNPSGCSYGAPPSGQTLAMSKSKTARPKQQGLRNVTTHC